MSDEQLGRLREQIDQLDDQMLKLLNKRAEHVIKVGEVKSQDKSAEETSFYRPEREAQILQRLRQLNEGPLSDKQVALIFREVISMSLALEQSLTVSYLGPEGTYSHSAALKQFGQSIRVRPESSIFDVFQSVETEVSHFGVVPVENSTEGAVNQTFDSLIESDLRICNEVSLPIHHAFMAKAATDLESLETIYSHEQSLAQCRRWLRKHYPQTKTQAVSSNGEAARLVAQEAKTAAIAGELAARQFDLEIIHRNIEDQRSNATRFFVLSRQKVAQSGQDKTSILVYAANRAGSLLDVLTPFKRLEISLTRIVSRPAPAGNWSYVFFIDFDGHEDDEIVKEALSEVRSQTYDLKILGSYPRSTVA